MMRLSGPSELPRPIVPAAIFILAVHAFAQYQLNVGGIDRNRYSTTGTIRYAGQSYPRWSAGWQLQRNSIARRDAQGRLTTATYYGRFAATSASPYRSSPGFKSVGDYRTYAGAGSMGTIRYGAHSPGIGSARSFKALSYANSWNRRIPGASRGTLRYSY